MEQKDPKRALECVVDLNLQSKMIVFGVTFEMSVIFWSSWGSGENWFFSLAQSSNPKSNQLDYYQIEPS